MLFESHPISIYQSNANTSNYMESQVKSMARSKLDKRYLKAVSNELSRKISSGNYKYKRLGKVITEPKFQKTYMPDMNKIYQTNELVNLILNPREKDRNSSKKYASSQAVNMQSFTDDESLTINSKLSRQRVADLI